MVGAHRKSNLDQVCQDGEEKKQQTGGGEKGGQDTNPKPKKTSNKLGQTRSTQTKAHASGTEKTQAQDVQVREDSIKKGKGGHFLTKKKGSGGGKNERGG